MAAMTEKYHEAPKTGGMTAIVRHANGQSFCHLSATNGENPCHQGNKKEARKPLKWENLAGCTGLEPATSGLTGQRSNQLS